MGAHNFATTAYGKTAADAYRIACDNATAEHGWDAYNGTISTTEGFREVPLGQRMFTTAAIRRWEDRVLEDDRFEKRGDCACLALPQSHAKGQGRGVRAFFFVGWAAS